MKIRSGWVGASSVGRGRICSASDKKRGVQRYELNGGQVKRQNTSEHSAARLMPACRSTEVPHLDAPASEVAIGPSVAVPPSSDDSNAPVLCNPVPPSHNCSILQFALGGVEVTAKDARSSSARRKPLMDSLKVFNLCPSMRGPRRNMDNV